MKKTTKQAAKPAISSYEGRQDHIRKLALPVIETWTNQYQDRNYEIHHEVPEFTCICPKTGLPDFANIIIDYVPNEHCIELKSFKEYVVAYRDLGIFHEHVVNKIMDDFIKATRPRYISVTGDFGVRGGVKTITHVEFTDPKWTKKLDKTN